MGQIIKITESQVKEMVANIYEKTNGKQLTDLINENVEVSNKPKKTKVIKLTENEFKKMLLDLTKKVGTDK